MSTLPAPLVPGDVVFVVAPSSPFDQHDLWPGLAWVRSRYRVRMSAGALVRDGYLAGDDARRRAELARAMTDEEVRAILVARGGYGAMRVVEELPWEKFARRPKWIVGFSDATALHAMTWRRGIACVHGPNVTGLRAATPALRAAWLGALERPTRAKAWRGLAVVRSGRASGPAIGGNLTLLHAMAAAGRLSIPPAAVVFLEDVGERPYRVDRMLTSLVLGGYLAQASALVLGGFERCDPGGDGQTVDEALVRCTSGLGIPVVAGAPFGHGFRNEAFILGATVRVDGPDVHFGEP